MARRLKTNLILCYLTLIQIPRLDLTYESLNKRQFNRTVTSIWVTHVGYKIYVQTDDPIHSFNKFPGHRNTLPPCSL